LPEPLLLLAPMGANSKQPQPNNLPKFYVRSKVRKKLDTTVTEELRVRIFLTVYYGIVCAFAVHRCASVLSGREVLGEMPYLHIAMFAGFALIGWWLIASLRRVCNRIAALLYVFFYAIKIGTNFAKGVNVSLLEVTGCVVISAGMIAVIVGLIRAIGNEESRNQASINPSS
jgi:hypothetical protein